MIATEEQLNTLAEKETARLLVISDSHFHPSILRQIVEDKGRECDALLFLGDGIDDLIQLAEEYSHIPEDLSPIPPVLAFVRGNGDSSVCTYYTDCINRIDIPETDVITAAGKKIFMTHGHRFEVYYTTEKLMSCTKKLNCSAGLFGHTHVPYQERDGSTLILNPGSCANPRNHSDRSYVILTVSKDNPEIQYNFYSLN